MGVTVLFRCGGCEASAAGTTSLRKEFVSVSGRSWGFGRAVMTNTVEDVTPEGWTAFDPYTYCTYCPKCTREIWPEWFTELPAESEGTSECPPLPSES
jgi:hypothetical protein